MQLRTRQRLIGLLLLLLLAAILAPLVLRTPDQVRLALDMSIPEAPRLDEPSVAPVVGDEEQQATDQQIDDERQAVAEQGEEAVLADPPEPAADQAAAEPEALEPSDDGESEGEGADTGPGPGFTVQVASFSDEANARALVQRLKDADYNAYHETQEGSGNTWQRVFVGPEIQRDKAEQLRQRLADDKDFALQGLVRPFVP